MVSISKTGALTIFDFLTSSIGRKMLMSLTGIAWYLFVLMHMLANMLIFVSPEAYNHYSHVLISNPLIYVAEGALVVTLLVHALNGIGLTIRNWRTKPIQAAVCAKGPKGAPFAAKTMIFSGSLVLAFVILHLVTFKYGAVYYATYNGVEMRDLHKLVLEVFQNPGAVAWYVVALVFVGIHLFHGFSSSFQTLGLAHPRYTPFIKKAGYIYAFLVAAGFISQPLYVFFRG